MIKFHIHYIRIWCIRSRSLPPGTVTFRDEILSFAKAHNFSVNFKTHICECTPEDFLILKITHPTIIGIVCD